jgi:hypothetical protein
MYIEDVAGDSLIVHISKCVGPSVQVTLSPNGKFFYNILI